MAKMCRERGGRGVASKRGKKEKGRVKTGQKVVFKGLPKKLGQALCLLDGGSICAVLFLD